MFGIVVVTHGQLAREMVAAAEMIIGELPNVTAVSIGWHESPEEAEKEIENAISRVEDGSGTVLLTDMFGGTPTNLSLSLLEKDRLEVVTGVNLPMLIRIASLGEDVGGDCSILVADDTAHVRHVVDDEEVLAKRQDFLVAREVEQRRLVETTKGRRVPQCEQLDAHAISLAPPLNLAPINES